MMPSRLASASARAPARSPRNRLAMSARRCWRNRDSLLLAGCLARSAERAPSARRRAQARRARSPSRPGHAARERGEPPGCRTRPRAEPRSMLPPPADCSSPTSSRARRRARARAHARRHRPPTRALHAHVVALWDDDIVPLRARRLRVEVRGASNARGSAPRAFRRTAASSPTEPRLLQRRARGSSRASSSAVSTPSLRRSKLLSRSAWIASGSAPQTNLSRVVGASVRRTRRARETPSAPPARAGRTTIRSSLAASAAADRRRDRP